MNLQDHADHVADDAFAFVSTVEGSHAAPAGRVVPLTYDTRQLAAALGVSYSTMQKRCAAQAWFADELPRPMRVAGKRVWRAASVERWLADRELAQHGQVAS